MGPNPDAYTHKVRFAAFEGATQLRNRFATTPAASSLYYWHSLLTATRSKLRR